MHLVAAQCACYLLHSTALALLTEEAEKLIYRPGVGNVFGGEPAFTGDADAEVDVEQAGGAVGVRSDGDAYAALGSIAMEPPIEVKPVRIAV